MKAKLIGESSAGMTAVEIYDNTNNLVWSKRYFEYGATAQGYKTGMLDAYNDMINCGDVSGYDISDDNEEHDTDDTTGVVCEYDSDTDSWTGGNYCLGQSTEIVAALMMVGKLPVDDDLIDCYSDDVVTFLVDNIKKSEPLLDESSSF